MNPKYAKLSHVGLPTSDLEASVKWYKEVLGLKEAFRLEREDRTVLVYLHITEETFVELFAPRGDGKPPDKGHFSIQVSDIESLVEEVLPKFPEGSQHDTEVKTGLDGSRLFNMLDPDGHRIEFQEFAPESQEAQAVARIKKA